MRSAVLQEDRTWPEEDLERLSSCPVCGGVNHEKMFENLRDLIFFTAPGIWILWRCLDCRAAYLSPRPNIASIGRAYIHYFTHTTDRELMGQQISLITRLRHSVRNNYLNHYFGYRLRPSLPGGWLAITRMPSLCRRALHYIRHLPFPSDRQNQLLDIGSGNGDFLSVAQALGYSAKGLESDPIAVKVTQERGLDVVQGSIPGSAFPPMSFHQITLSHVIEHLHDPVSALREVFEILKPGGRVWIQTPNIDANGRKHFGAAWRGLEPPRHLVLFNFDSLSSALSKAGFQSIKRLSPGPEVALYFRQSLSVLEGKDPNHNSATLSRALMREARGEEKLVAHRPELAESITIVAQR